MAICMTCAACLICPPKAEAHGWATAGQVMAGIAAAGLLLNGCNTMDGRVYTGDRYYDGYPHCGHHYRRHAPRRCWDEVRRRPVYDDYGYFIGYVDEIVTVCED